jgi:catechol 2,3-dioxygenase-like lactoylglutathione lyase family enzyme
MGIRVGMTGRQAAELMLQAAPAPASVAGIHVKGIDHVTLVVKDLERSRRFYVDVLGMREVPRPAFSFAGSWFQAGETQIHLILEYAGSGPAGNLLPAEKRGSRTQHLAFLVDDAVACVELLKEKGVPILSEVKPRPDGYLQVFVTDPDGHVVELCSAPR